MVDKILVDFKALHRVLNYIMDDEERDYLECKEIFDWTEEQLSQHVYVSLVQLEKDFIEGDK